MQRKLLTIIALVAVQFSLTAQSIRVFNSCREQTRVFTFAKLNTKADPSEWFKIGSWCPGKAFPTYHLDRGIYEFSDLPVRENEEWSWFIENEDKTTQRGIVKDNHLFADLENGERLTIVIAPKLECHCPKTTASN